MIYDITDIINDTHQFSCLIEGGCRAYPGTKKGHCPQNVKTPLRTPHPQVTSLPLSPLFLFPSLASYSCYSGIEVSSTRPVQQRAMVHMLWINLKSWTVVFTCRYAFIHIFILLCVCADSIMATMSVRWYTVIYDSWRCVWGICNSSSTLRTRDNKVVHEYLICREKV